ncbi:hypothetical protein H1R20_g123, partial [Candolleomyces eurysporus]
MTLPRRAKYSGSTRGLALAFDIGTTFSGISYSILDPGRVSEIRPITRYPCQEHVGGDMKVPTVVYYDHLGKPRAIGAEALKEGIEVEAEEQGWVKSHWFKLHLRPKSTTWRARDEEPLPPLPPNKPIEHIFADFMAYLYRCSEDFIAQTHGEVTWKSVQKNIYYILTHPNGWGGPQQAGMRRAAVLAGLVSESAEDQSRITFVTEGEASLHYCLLNGLTVDGMDGTAGITIVDAGGGYYQGAVFVTRRAEVHFNNALAGTKYRQDVPTITNAFDKSAKHVFRKVDEPLQIRFASPSENDAALNIRSGRIIVDGITLAQFFEPSVSCVVDAIKVQNGNLKSHCPIKSAFLVGGFSASDWLYDQVREAIEPLGISVLRPDTHRVKYSERLKKLYCEITFDVILLFGLTELQAQIAFVDSSGEEKRGPAQVVYEKV